MIGKEYRTNKDMIGEIIQRCGEMWRDGRKKERRKKEREREGEREPQQPFGPSVGSLCHPRITTTRLPYKLPIFESSATVLRTLPLGRNK
jgi:hypothetical protein